MTAKKDESSFGPMAMVKIDGAKVKRLREQQGLTQLYVATAVEVTTDTISRWENGRYPSIKRDNGIRLAETLEVPLDEILLAETGETTPAEISEEPTQQSQPLPTTHSQTRTRKRYYIAVGIAVALLLCFAYFFKGFISQNVDQQIIATRISPSSALPGQRVPVIIHVEGATTENPSTIIIKETIPEETQPRNISPAPSLTPASNAGEIKWLDKLVEKKKFSYILKAAEQMGGNIDFEGTYSSRGESDHEIAGSIELTTGKFHWADENKDGIIDDREIILVYDRYSDISGFKDELETIEQIWLGSGYLWDEKQHKLIILGRETSEERSK